MAILENLVREQNIIWFYFCFILEEFFVGQMPKCLKNVT